VIFLGAGASKSEKAPLQNELFKKYFFFDKSSEHEEINERLSEFFKDFFAININKENLDEINFPTFEEVLGILELSLDRKESFKNYDLTRNRPKIQQIREDLIFLIALVLDKELIHETKFHKKLVNRLIEEDKIQKTSFVSLNYDIILDNALTDIYWSHNLDLDYGIEFTNFKNNDDWKQPQPSRAVHLYKPHGSLNWLYCPTCISTTLTPKEKGVTKLIFKPKRCEKCGTEMIPIIIPPTFFKVMSNRYLQEIWYKTENALNQAKKIYFCGYSFPDADIHIKYLLKRAEINSNSTPEIYIINSSESKDTKLRYERFFKSNKVNWTGYSFQDFCKNDLE
jgi:hypothetical protein